MTGNPYVMQLPMPCKESLPMGRLRRIIQDPPFFARQKKRIFLFSCGATPSRTVPKTKPLQVAFPLQERVDLGCQKEGILGKKIARGRMGRTGQKKEKRMHKKRWDLDLRPAWNPENSWGGGAEKIGVGGGCWRECWRGCCSPLLSKETLPSQHTRQHPRQHPECSQRSCQHSPQSFSGFPCFSTLGGA